MADESMLGVPSLIGILVLVIPFLTWYRNRDPLLDAIPTIGYSDPILSYFSAFRYYFLDGQSMVKEGYKKSKPGLFKIPTFSRWMVVPTSAELIEDIKKAPENILSRNELARERVQSDYTLRMLNSEDTYETDLVRSKLTRNIAVTFEQVRDEVIKALAELIPADGDEWVKISIQPTVKQIISRATGRIFVGSPLCWNRDYQKLAIGVSESVLKSAYILALFPKPLKPIVARFVSKYPSQVRKTKEFIGPMVKERFAKMEELGEAWDDAPNDMLMWLMSEAKGVEKSLDGLARRMLFLYLASIHSTSRTSTQVLYHLLSNPKYFEPLRQEIEAAIAEEGWTKAGMDKLHKLDSFLRETQRMNTTGIVVMYRLALRPFTFSNGVTIPKGTIVSIPASAIHMDENIYSNPEQFDGFRFSKARDMGGDITTIHSAVSTSPEYLAFGLGRHTCPGRFFAVNEIKALVARIIMTYDIKFEEGQEVPRPYRMGTFRLVQNANVLFRKRQM